MDAEEFVRATDFDALLSELAAALARVEYLEKRLCSYGFARWPPAERRPRIERREKKPALDVAPEQAPHG